MAYFLKSNGIDQYVNLASLVSIPSAGGEFRIEIDMQAIDGADFGVRIFGKSGTSAGRMIIDKGDNGTMRTDVLITAIGAAKNILNRNVIGLQRLAGVVSGDVNGDQMPTTGTIGSGFTFQWLLSESSATNARNPLNLYSMKVWIAGVLTHHWDPSASNGTGTTLIDVVGGNNGTLINYASDADAWEFYSDGPTAYSIVADTVTDSHTANDVTLTYSGAATAYTLTADTVADTHSAGDVTLTYSAAGTATITSEPLKDNTGALLANQALDYVAIYDNVTGALVLRVTGISTNASGVFSVSDAALTAGVTYKLDWKVTIQSAARMPAKAAV